MNKLDKKILQELTINSRQSYKQIAHTIGSKKDSVAYSIKKLEREGIINKYVSVVSLNKLNLFTGKIYFNLKGLNKEKEEEVISWLKKHNKIVWVAKSIGSWNLMIGFILDSIYQFAEQKREILNYLSEYLADYKISFIEDGFAFDRKYLFSNTRERKKFLYGGDIKKVEIDITESRIIQLIKNDARFEYITLTEKLNLDARTIKHKIDGLKEKGILQGFTVFLNINAIGYQLHKLCIYLDKHSLAVEHKIIEYLKENPFMIHLIKCIGDWEIEIEMELDNIIKVHDYIAELRNKFHKEIKRIDLVTITKEEKLNFFPTIEFN